MLSIFLLERPDPDWEELEAFVVAAAGKASARKLAATHCVSHHKGEKISKEFLGVSEDQKKNATCKKIGVAVNDARPRILYSASHSA